MVRILYPALQQPVGSGTDDTRNMARWWTQWVDPYSNLNAKKSAIVHVSGQTLDPFPRGTPEFVGPDKWWQPFSERLYPKAGLAPQLQQTLAYSESAQFPESTSIDRYLYPFGLPVWQKPRLIPGAQPAAFPDSKPAISIGWYIGLSEPKRFPQRLLEASQHFYESNEEPPELDDVPWFRALSEPKRFPQRIIESNQHFFEAEEEPPELDDMPWFRPFSEPKRFPLRLEAARNPAVFPNPQALTTPYSRGYIIC